MMMIRKNIYKWHRVCSLIIAVPVLLWAASGFMHPIMTNLRPAVKTQSIKVEPVDSNKIKLSLKNALAQNKIDTVYGVRLIHIDTNWFYQVKVSSRYDIWYISTKNGKVLPKGDWLYAQYLARLFLEGQKLKSSEKPGLIPKPMPAGTDLMGTENMSRMSDCCGEAANTVLNNKTGAPIENASLVTKFNDEYKPIYCLLPVYNVQFKRSDHIRLYVETTQDRFSIAVDDNRAAFTNFFDLVHTWGWINFLGKGRLFVEMLFTCLGFFTAAMGLYLFFGTRRKESKGNQLVKWRNIHRITSIIAVLFTLMFTFSGFYHAFCKLGAKEKEVKSVLHGFAANDIDLDLRQLRLAVNKPIINVGLVALGGETYWQVYLQGAKNGHKSKDLMKDMSAPPTNVAYINTHNYTILSSGDELYARNLSTRFSGHKASDIVSAELVTKFTDEYNFTDKRLPIWKVNYPFNHNERYYVETSTGTLAKNTNDVDLLEGYSFALFHKHHYMDFAGKTTRDISTMVGAGLQILMVAIGLTLYLRWKKNKTKRNLTSNRG